MRLSPDRSLLVLAAVLLLPAVAWLVWSAGAALAWLLIVVVLSIVGIDALRTRRLLSDLDLETDAIVRSTVGRAVTVDLRFLNRGQRVNLLRAGLEMAAGLRVEDSPVVEWASALEEGAGVRLSLDLVPLRRGRFRIRRCHVETTSPWRLWLIRRALSVDLEIRAYPDLRAERRKLSALFLHRGADGSQALRQMGKGREFEKLREYQAGDDFGDIDWKATSRRGMPITRTYQIERTQEVYVVVDHSRLSGREIRRAVSPSSGQREVWQETITEHESGGEFIVETQLEAFLKCALVLSSVAEMQGDLFGFVGFSNRVDRFIRSRNGAQHYQLIRDSVYTMEPEAVAPDFEELMVTLSQRLTRRALLVMLVDLSDPLTAESFYEAVPIVARQHVVLVNMVRPEAAHPLFAGKVDDAPQDLDGVYRCLSGHLQWRDLIETAQRLSRIGVELGLPDQAELSAEAVSQYLQVKRRQLI
jgi:uncharacterized protein (DUF58 family)